MRRMLECLLAALCIAMVLMLPAAQADDGTAWMDEPCPVTGIHSLQFEDIQIGDCTHESIVRWYCPDCGKSHNDIEPAPGHQWDEGKVTKEPTCTEAGERTYTCTRLITNIWCGATYTETIPALGHDPETISGKAATCTESGLTEGSRCKRCGGTIKAQETIPALGHSWDGGKVTKEPTCTAAGEKTYTCTRCGATRKDSIPALGHAPQAISGKAATCTEAGLTEGSKCSRCGTVLKAQETIPALGHDWDGGKVTKEATVDAEGVRTYTCKRNSSHTKTESIPRLAPPPVTDPPAHTHKWGDWFVEEKGTCVKKALLRRVCACGAEEYQYGGYGDHDWGEWHTVKEPTATEDGLEERICKIESSHREEKPIPATGKAELTIYLEAQDYDTEVPKTEFREGESAWFDGCVVNTGTVDLELRDCVWDIPGGHWNGATPETQDGIVLKPGEKYEGVAFWFVSRSISVSAADVAPGTETAELYGTVTYSVQVPGYKPGTDEVLCTAAASCTIGVLKDENALKPSLLVTTTWAPDAGAGKRYVGAIVNVDDTLTNTGNCDLYLPNKDGRADSVDAPHPKGDGELSDHYRLAPGESLTVHNYHHFVLESDVEKGALYRNGFSTTYSAYYMDENGEKQRIFSNSFEENIPLTYPDGVTPEEKKPQLTLTFLYDYPAKEVYDPEDSVWARFSLANTGNVPLKAVAHFTSDGVREYDYDDYFFNPGDSVTEDAWGWHKIQRGITPGTETEDLLGTVTIHFYYKGLDPDTGEELCRTQTITRTWKVGKPGFTPWPIPEESDIYGKLTTGASASSAGYQLGELYIVMLEIQNTGKVTIPADGITFSDPSNGQTYSVFSNDFKPGESGIAFGWLHLITEEDVKNGFVYYPPVQLTWTDPDSGNPRTVYTNSLTLIVSNRTGLLLTKDIGNGPENGSYYREGETIPWTLTATNNSNEPIRNVTVTDQGVTVGTFQEIAAGETVTCNVPPYVVTEYDAFAGKVSNYATATGEDLRGTVHTWNSNTVTAPTNQFADPLPPEDGKTGEPKEDPGDPMGAVYGLHAGASVRKEEDGGPMNGSYYELDEEIHFTITVKNTGDTPLENVSVVDSLNGFAPIGTAASIAPGAEVPFQFTHKVTQPDIDAGWVTNSATVIYTFDGGKPGTPQKSNEVKVKAGDKEDNTTGGGGHFTPIPPAAPFDGTLQPVTLPDGTPLTTPDGKPIIAPPGTVPVIGPDGKPVTAPGGVYTGPDGTPVYIPAGTPVLMLPDGSYCVIGSDGRAILTDANGNPILDGNGFVIFLGWSIESVTCELRLDSLGDSEAAYTLHACSEHAGAAKDAEAAGLAGDWAGAAEIWRGEVEKLYEKFYEAADDEGKAALVQERAAFLAYADAWQALAGDEAAAETLRFKCAEMCCILHTLPAELPGSIVGSHREVINGQQWDQSVREIGALNGADSAVTETYAGAEARTLKDIRTMLAGAKTYNYGDVFERGRRCWQITLDNAVNIAYKAADKETRKRIVAWRTALDTLYEAEKPLLEMLYPDSDTTVWEELMNLYKDRVFDSVKIR